MSDDTITRNWRVVKEGEDYRLRQVDHAKGWPEDKEPIPQARKGLE